VSVALTLEAFTGPVHPSAGPDGTLLDLSIAVDVEIIKESIARAENQCYY